MSFFVRNCLDDDIIHVHGEHYRFYHNGDEVVLRKVSTEELVVAKLTNAIDVNLSGWDIDSIVKMLKQCRDVLES